ncbi:MAG: hypothetical protein MI725_17270 [Pirellulales bacterium]|nr:hypothetical protein [Pirellulales bacterium]
MTRFTVVWEDDTESQLAEYWNDAASRSKVSAAADHIDHELATDAHLKGSELSEGLRCLRYSPLAAYYSVEPDDRMVKVWALRLIP